jgi:hypothetical protein
MHGFPLAVLEGDPIEARAKPGGCLAVDVTFAAPLGGGEPCGGAACPFR